MKTKVSAMNMELTESLANYATKKFSSLDKYFKVKKDDVWCEVLIGKTSHHHKKGDYFEAEVKIHTPGKIFLSKVITDDMYKSIDNSRDDIEEEIVATKTKKETLWKRGAAKIKHLLRKNN